MSSDQRDIDRLLRERILRVGESPYLARAAALAVDGDTDPSSIIPTVAATVRNESHRLTDTAVAALRAEVGSDRAAFEVLLAASVGAGLERRADALRVIQEAVDATR